jgi:hypothetical protein
VDAEAFVRLALTRARRGVAMLVRLGFLETVGRYAMFTGQDRPVLICPFAERVPMQLGSWDPKLRSAAGYCLIVWARGRLSEDFHNIEPILRPIPPGRRVTLSRASDMAFAEAQS